MTKYKLYFPFNFDKTHLEPLEVNEIKWNIPDLKLQVTIKGTLCVFNVDNLASQVAAKDILNRIWAGVVWLMLKRDIPFRTNLDYEMLDADQSKTVRNLSRRFGTCFEIDGSVLIDDNRPAICPSETIINPRGINATGYASDKFETVFPVIESVITVPQSSEIRPNDKLRLALELYNSHFYETSGNAKFAILVIVLETLCEPAAKHKIIQELFDKWQAEVEELKTNFDSQTDQFSLLEELQKDLFWKNYNSKSNQLKNLVRTTLISANYADASKLANRAYEIYGLRGKLVHQGYLSDDELVNALSDIKQIVQKVLKVKFCRAIGKDLPIGEL